MAPTRRGVVVLVVGALAVLAGWLLGLPETSFLGVAAIAGVGVAAVLVGLGGPGPVVHRVARPARLAVGDACDIALSARNGSASRWSPVVQLVDDVGVHGRAEVLLGPIPPTGRSGATYSLSTTRRGVHRIGPLRSQVADPFGLVVRRTSSNEPTTVVIFPRAVPLDPLPAAIGDEPELGVHSMVASSTVDEEFTGLRAYVPGDDVRRIHWPSTARAGSAVVRQFEVPWQHRTTVLVDLRASRHDPESFERMLTVVASLVLLGASRSELLRLGTTADIDPPFVPAAAQLDALLDGLAVVQPESPVGSDDEQLVAMVERATSSPTGRLVVCTGHLDPAELARARAAASRAGLAMLVTTGTGAASGDGPGPAHVQWDGAADLAETWRAAVARSLPVTGGHR